MAVTFSTMEFRPAPAIVSLEGPSFSGKTLSGLLMAIGLAGGDPSKVAVIDAEGGRATRFMHRFHGRAAPMYAEIGAPYRSGRYLEYIRAAKEAGASAVLIDTGSHEHEGEGGMLDWAAAELDRMAGKDFAARERCKMASWIEPKRDRNRLVVGALNPPIMHQVWTFRAKSTVHMDPTKKGKGRVTTTIDPIGGLAYEMTFRFELRAPPPADNPGRLWPVKWPENADAVLMPGELSTEAVGMRIAEWARTGSVAAPMLTMPDGSKLKPEKGALSRWLEAWFPGGIAAAGFRVAAKEAAVIYADVPAALAMIREAEEKSNAVS